MSDMIKEAVEYATEHFLKGIDQEKAQGLEPDTIASSLQELITDSAGKLDLGNIVSQLKDQGLDSIVDSWLGNGENSPVSADTIKNVFDGEKLSNIAAKLGLDEDSVLSGVTNALPNIIDKCSPDGDLVDMAESLFNSVKKLF